MIFHWLNVSRVCRSSNSSIVGPLYEQFMHQLVAELDNSWELNSADIDAALAELRD
jgi:hypothetical protein